MRFEAYFSFGSYGAKRVFLAPHEQKSQCTNVTSPIQLHGKQNEIQSELVKQGLAYSI